MPLSLLLLFELLLWISGIRFIRHHLRAFSLYDVEAQIDGRRRGDLAIETRNEKFGATAAVNPIWFGVLMMLLMETALITPPVGMNLFVVQGVRKRGEIRDVIIGSLPFVITTLCMIGVLILFPEVAMWLPNEFSGR